MRRFALGAACALVCAIGPAGGASAAVVGQDSDVQGNPQGVQLAERAAQAFARVPAFTYSERGFFQVQVSGRSISYYYGSALQPGFVWAAEQGTVALQDGAVAWWRDFLTPSQGSPVELVANSNGVFSKLGGASCFTRLDPGSSVPYPYGGQAYSPDGRYLNGGSPLHSVYRWWSTGQTAYETDSITPSGLITSGQVSVGGLSFDFTNNFLSGRPPAPQVNACR